MYEYIIRFNSNYGIQGHIDLRAWDHVHKGVRLSRGVTTSLCVTGGCTPVWTEGAALACVC